MGSSFSKNNVNPDPIMVSRSAAKSRSSHVASNSTTTLQGSLYSAQFSLASPTSNSSLSCFGTFGVEISRNNVEKTAQLLLDNEHEIEAVWVVSRGVGNKKALFKHWCLKIQGTYTYI